MIFSRPITVINLLLFTNIVSCCESLWESCPSMTNCTFRCFVDKDLVLKPSFPVTPTKDGNWALSRKSAVITNDNVQQVGELICSQEGDSGTHLSTRQISAKLNISQTSVCRIAKRSLHLKSFRRVPAQVIDDMTWQKRLERARALLRCVTVRKTKDVFFTDEKNFYLNPPICNQEISW